MKYERVRLSPDHAAQMRAHQDKVIGLQRAIQMFVDTGERRGAQLQQEGRDLYAGIATEHKLDMTRVMYMPSEDGNELIPVQIKLADDNGAG